MENMKKKELSEKEEYQNVFIQELNANRWALFNSRLNNFVLHIYHAWFSIIMIFASKRILPSKFLTWWAVVLGQT